jgi:16S rRNA (guanine(527)-N(7))-methyltransferase RsmG
MDSASIAALLAPFLERPLSQFQLDQISIYIDLLLRWNARMNLTAIRNEKEIVTRHFGESLFLARNLYPDPSNPGSPKDLFGPDDSCHPEAPSHPERSQVIREAGDAAESKDPYPFPAPRQEISFEPLHPPRIVDIGSGAGFPAIPLTIWAPTLHLTLIESNHKKAAFLSEVARTLTLTNINVMTDRAEVLAPRLSSQAEVVTLRAVERLETILPKAVTFLAPKGILAMLITTAQLPVVKTLTKLTWRLQLRIPESNTRLLSILQNE